MTTEVRAAYRCDGCTSCFPLRDLFVLGAAPEGDLPEMRCVGCLHQKILQANGGIGVDLATFHEIVGGPAVEALREGS